MLIKLFDFIELRSLQETDAPDIFQVIDKERTYLGQWLPFVAKTKKVADTKAFVKAALTAAPKNDEEIFTLRKRNQFIGLVGFKNTDRDNRKTEIGYWLSESFQKQGIVTKAVDELCHYAFTQLNINRIQIKCATGNQASKKIPQRLNFFFEGIERDGELLSDGNFIDLEVYSKLRKDLPKSRSPF
ncbi:MAG: GNAT family protein [Bacteroidales bacterium]|jgi:ribosomal-protein-serine acetyltransferase